MTPVSLTWTPLVWLGLGAIISIILRARRLNHLRTWRLVVATFFLVCSVVLATIVLLDPSLSDIDKERSLSALFDISDSMDPDTSSELLLKLKELGPTTLHSFGKNLSPELVESSGSIPSLSSLRSRAREIGADKSDLFKALEKLPNVPLILASDGWMTGSSEEEILSLVRSRGTPMFPLIPSAESDSHGPDVAVSNLTVPFQAPAKTSVAIRAAVKNDTAKTQSGRFVIRDGEKTILDKNVSISANTELPFAAKTDADAAGLHRIEVSFSPSDPSYPTSKKIAVINSQRRERVLLLSGIVEEGETLQELLTSQSYELVTVHVGSGTIPLFSDFSAIILNNVGAQQLGTAKLDSLVPFIENGGGLIMVGGNRSFGLGGYRGSTLEPYLPVKLLPPRAEQKRINSAVALVLDKSNSMGELRKLDYAKEAAEEVVRNLKDDDYLSVIGFDNMPFVVVKMNQLRENRAQALERIKYLFPKLGTNLVPAMDEARRQLLTAKAGKKHVIVLTDGMLRANQSFLIQMSEEFRREGITTSTVLVGLFQDSTMSEMARLGGGIYHQTNDPTALPRIFLSDIKVNAGERTLRETSDFTVSRKQISEPITTVKDIPQIQGFVETLPHPQALPELTVGAEDGDRPLLASWKKGRGRVIALTTDAAGRWTSRWIRWAQNAQLWSDLITSARGKSGTDSSVRYDLSVKQRYGMIELDVALYNEQAARDFAAKLNQMPLLFQTIAPGHLRSIIRDPVPGTYTIYPSVGSRSLPESSFIVDPLEIAEQTGNGTNRALLRRLADASGGLVNPSREYLDQLGTSKREVYSISPALLIASVVFFLASLALRLWESVRAR